MSKEQPPIADEILKGIIGALSVLVGGYHVLSRGSAISASPTEGHDVDFLYLILGAVAMVVGGVLVSRAVTGKHSR